MVEGGAFMSGMVLGISIGTTCIFMCWMFLVMTYIVGGDDA